MGVTRKQRTPYDGTIRAMVMAAPLYPAQYENRNMVAGMEMTVSKGPRPTGRGGGFVFPSRLCVEEAASRLELDF